MQCPRCGQHSVVDITKLGDPYTVFGCLHCGWDSLLLIPHGAVPLGGGGGWVMSGQVGAQPFADFEATSTEIRDASRLLLVRALARLLQEQDESVMVLRPDDPPSPDLWVEVTEDENGVPITIISLR